MCAILVYSLIDILFVNIHLFSRFVFNNFSVTLLINYWSGGMTYCSLSFLVSFSSFSFQMCSNLK